MADSLILDAVLVALLGCGLLGISYARRCWERVDRGVRLVNYLVDQKYERRSVRFASRQLRRATRLQHLIASFGRNHAAPLAVDEPRAEAARGDRP